MDLETLKKKLSSFKTPGGHLKKVSDELLLEILKAWEEWQGGTTKFYTSIGTSQRQFAQHLGKAKKLKREGHGAAGFEEVIAAEFGPVEGAATAHGPCNIELVWDGGKLIRFAKVETLVDFLKQAA